MDKLQLLKKFWGFDQFRPNQEEIINSLLSGEDVLGILPTGGGKSLCYQLPALLHEGSVLVVSPLVALMEDQVKQLEQKEIKAMYFESHPKSLPLQQQLDNSIHGNYKLIYTSPERFLNPNFVQRLAQANISLVAIDEAHCISEWGHDFRPAYRELGILPTLFPNTPILALTASATPEVVKDIKVLLHLQKAQLFQSSYKRPNIGYQIWQTEDKFNTAAQLLNHHKGTSIIYCNTRKQTEDLAQFLKQRRYQVDYFHGGLPADSKKQRLAAWQQGKIHHIAATTAFGMGIDKADVRMVIHLQLPESIENYYQETGRAGRDQKAATSFLLFHSGDPKELKSQFLDKIPKQKDLEGTYKDLCNFLQIAYGEGKNTFFSLDLERFCKRYERNLSKTRQVLRLFEQVGIFSLASSHEQQMRLRITASTYHIRTYLNQSSTAAMVLEYLMRQSSHLISETFFLSPKKLSQAMKLSNRRLMLAFEDLQRQNILMYSVYESHIYLNALTPREDLHTIRPAIDLSKKIYGIKKKKIETLIEFVTDTTVCKRNALLAYFGEKAKGVCGLCSATSCKKAFIEEADLKPKLIQLLKSKPHSIPELKQKLYFEPQALHQLLKGLLDEEQIIMEQGHKYHWNYE